MQNAKDTFYEVLRQRLSALNPERTISLRGVLRPGLLVEENELLSAVPLPDCFRMSWTEVTLDFAGAFPLVTMQCAFAYETAGSSTNGGMDRGRTLEDMDAELSSAIGTSPTRAMKMNYSELAKGGAPIAMQTSLWWGGLVLGKIVADGNKVARTASVQVMSYQEVGEL